MKRKEKKRQEGKALPALAVDQPHRFDLQQKAVEVGWEGGERGEGRVREREAGMGIIRLEK